MIDDITREKMKYSIAKYIYWNCKPEHIDLNACPWEVSKQDFLNEAEKVMQKIDEVCKSRF